MEQCDRGALIVGILAGGFFASIWGINLAHRRFGGNATLGAGIGCILGAITWALIHYCILVENQFSPANLRVDWSFAWAVVLWVLIGAAIVLTGAVVEAVGAAGAWLRRRRE